MQKSSKLAGEVERAGRGIQNRRPGVEANGGFALARQEIIQAMVRAQAASATAMQGTGVVVE